MRLCVHQLSAIGLSGLPSSLTTSAKHVESNPTSRKPNSTSRLAFAFLTPKTTKNRSTKKSMETARKTAVFACQRVARFLKNQMPVIVKLYPPLLIGGYTTKFGEKRYGKNALYLGKNTNTLKNSHIFITGRSLVVIVVKIAFLCVPFGVNYVPKKRQ